MMLFHEECVNDLGDLEICNGGDNSGMLPRSVVDDKLLSFFRGAIMAHKGGKKLKRRLIRKKQRHVELPLACCRRCSVHERSERIGLCADDVKQYNGIMTRDDFIDTGTLSSTVF
jgi:hypothetical protein